MYVQKKIDFKYLKIFFSRNIIIAIVKLKASVKGGKITIFGTNELSRFFSSILNNRIVYNNI